MNYISLAEAVIAGKSLTPGEALGLIKTGDDRTFELISAANTIRAAFKGNKVKLCAIVNAKSGKCSEDCSFCAQSGHHKTDIKSYPLLSGDEIVSTAAAAEKEMKATCFSIVTSGKSVHNDEEIAMIAAALKRINQETGMNRCVSLGTLKPGQIAILKKNGLKRLHHNLETAESFFKNICTTHTYQERIETIKAAKRAGLEVCSGGIFGLGESLEQRVELALALRELQVESVPINILNPIPGTPAAKDYKPMQPFEILRLLATYRFILPKADIGIFGGREKSLGEYQSLMFSAGANVTLIGDYLTTKGQAAEKDLQMIEELGLEVG